MKPSIARRGATLVELIVVIVILAVLASVATMAMRKFAVPVPTDPRVIIRTARRQALSNGQPATTMVVVNGASYPVTVFPDGSVLADSVVGVSRLTATFPDSAH